MYTTRSQTFKHQNSIKWIPWIILSPLLHGERVNKDVEDMLHLDASHVFASHGIVWDVLPETVKNKNNIFFPYSKCSWWFQPKKILVKLRSFPQVGVLNMKNMSNHQPVLQESGAKLLLNRGSTPQFRGTLMRTPQRYPCNPQNQVL